MATKKSKPLSPKGRKTDATLRKNRARKTEIAELHEHVHTLDKRQGKQLDEMRDELRGAVQALKVATETNTAQQKLLDNIVARLNEVNASLTQSIATAANAAEGRAEGLTAKITQLRSDLESLKLDVITLAEHAGASAIITAQRVEQPGHESIDDEAARERRGL